MYFLCVLAEMYMYPYMFMAELIIFSQHECLCFETCFRSVCKRECLSERVGESIRKGQRERKNERRKKEWRRGGGSKGKSTVYVCALACTRERERKRSGGGESRERKRERGKREHSYTENRERVQETQRRECLFLYREHIMYKGEGSVWTRTCDSGWDLSNTWSHRPRKMWWVPFSTALMPSESSDCLADCLCVSVCVCVCVCSPNWIAQLSGRIK